MLKGKGIIVLTVFAILFFLSATLRAEQDTITVGRVSDNPKKHYKRIRPFVHYMARHLKPMGINRGKLILAKSNHELIKYIREGKIDIITETAYSTIIFMEKAGVKPILRRWKKYVPAYHSIIFVRNDSGINSLKDLKGKIIAFEDPGSTSAYFLPKVAIMEAGLETVELGNYSQTPPPDKVGYCFAMGEPNIAHWVHKGLVAAGALSNVEYYDDEMPSQFRKDVKIIHESENVPRNIISVRGDMAPEMEKEIKNILLNMKNSPEGKDIMHTMAKTTEFDEFPGGVEKFIRNFKEKYTYIKEEIEKEYPE